MDVNQLILWDNCLYWDSNVIDSFPYKKKKHNQMLHFNETAPARSRYNHRTSRQYGTLSTSGKADLRGRWSCDQMFVTNNTVTVSVML